MLEQLDALLTRCSAVYGEFPRHQPVTCYEAWLDSDRARASRFVRERWHLMEGGIAGVYIAGDAVATRAEPGLLAHLVLPPCLAVEEGGARLQSFSRDFQGATCMRIPVRAVERTGVAPWHGLVALRNMFREEQRDSLSLGIRVE